MHTTFVGRLDISVIQRGNHLWNKTIFGLILENDKKRWTRHLFKSFVLVPCLQFFFITFLFAATIAFLNISK